VGGFQAVEWAVTEPQRIGKLVLIATSAKASPWSIAIDETQRMAIEADRTFGEPRDGRLFLSKVYLLHEARGQGRFRQMLEYLRGLCREVGARTIWLTVNRRNERAIGAYRRAGFREVRAQVTDIGGGYVMDDYIMELETTPQKE